MKLPIDLKETSPDDIINLIKEWARERAFIVYQQDKTTDFVDCEGELITDIKNLVEEL